MQKKRGIAGWGRRLVRWFFQGLVVTAPVGITVYLLAISFTFLDGLFHYKFPGLGILLLLLGITLIGALGSTLLAKPLLRYLDGLLERAPLVKVIYGALKDLLTAFVGDEKRFNRPVRVKFGPEGAYRLGYLTETNAEPFGLEKGFVGVYLPHSYNFSGNFYIVPEAWVEPLNLPSSEVMKYVVSGGVISLSELESAQSKEKRTENTKVRGDKGP